VLAVAICCALTRPGVKAQPSSYTYTVIADVTNCFVGSPVINNEGEVAFGGRCSPGGDLGVIRRGDGGPLTTIFTGSLTSPVPNVDVISINDSGVVAFSVNGSCGFNTAILTGDGGPIETVVDRCANPGPTEVHRPSISNTGAVAFGQASGNNFDKVILAKNGTFVTIAGPGTSPPGIEPLSMAYEPSINNNDVVTFMGNVADTGAGVLFTGAGGPLTIISFNSLGVFNGINDLGRVAFLANPGAIQTGDGGPVTTIATRTFEGGAYQSFGGEASINAAGKVAFLGWLPSGEVGVFTGPDPETDKILKTGEPLHDSLGVLLGTVTGIGITREAINDSGQVAMAVAYNDAGTPKVAIIRADPPNHPPVASDDSFSVTAGGSVSDTLSATDPDTEPITYSIVTNGTKGRAVIDNLSTGAFTYSANVDASGDDTFTFKVTDNRGLESNVATITVAIDPRSACAVDVTSSVAPVKGKGTKGPSLTHPIALLNTSSSAIVGPVSIALDSLTAGATLLNAAGVTLCAAPAGSPYLNIDLGSDSVWSPGERVDFVLEFAHESTAQGKKPVKITYTQRVLAGAGGR
jgi:hypothetical protein